MFDDRLKDTTIEINGIVFDSFSINSWEISHTLNNKIFTFSEFIEAYVNKLDSNGYNLSLTLTFSGLNYDLEAKNFRSALQSRGVCKIMLPLGQDTFVYMHCVRISEKWDVVDSLGLCEFSLDFHTHNNKFGLPKTAIDIFDEISTLGNSIIEINGLFDIPKEILPQAIINIKTVAESFDSIVKDELKSDVLAVGKSLDLLTYLDNLDVTFSKNLDVFHRGFVELLSIPRQFSLDFIKTSRVYSSLSNILNDLKFFNDEKHSFFYANNHSFTETAMFFSNFAEDLKEESILPRSDVLRVRKTFDDNYKKFINTLLAISPSQNNFFVKNGFFLKQEKFNNLQLITSKTLDNFEKIMLKSKVENTVYSNDFVDFYDFCNAVYNPGSADELEDKVRELLRFNNFVGSNLFGLQPQTKIKYLI